MPDKKDSPEKDNKDSKDNKENEARQPSRSLLVWLAVLGIVPLLLLLMRDRNYVAGGDLSYPRFEYLVTNDLVISGRIVHEPQNRIFQITGIQRAGQWDTSNKLQLSLNPGDQMRFRLETPLKEDLENKMLDSGKFRWDKPNTLLISIVSTVLPFLIIAAFIYFFLFRQIRMAGKGALSFGKSKARMLARDKNRTTFKNVAGVEEAKEEVAELVDFLKDPKKFQKLGGKIPKGVLMIGAPGTGKTLLAKAIAGEAEAAFFSISGSDFVEMFVGVGASRVRDMFEQARKTIPCLIFIDEIDAVGRSRGHGLGGGNDEREQTLNALLVEMDGFETQDGIIIIAATNRPDVLDPALLRPGRFDRQITVNLPDIKGREAILKVHARNVKLASDVDLAVIARGTPGYSGAELANLLNEAALLAARSNKKMIDMTELEEARDKVRWGRERRSMAMSDEDKRITAWHEAGHALINVILDHTYPLHKVTIIPRGQSLGSTMSLPEQDVLNRRKKEMEDMIAVTMGGRIAEELFSHDYSTGAAGDIQMATNLARAMVCQFGMSERLGMVQYGDDSDYVFLGKDMIRSKDYSESTAKEIDEEVKRLIDEGYRRAKQIIDEHREQLEVIANSLLEYETLDGNQVSEIVKTGKFTPPPPPPVPAKKRSQKRKKAPKKDQIADEEVDPGFEGTAPATV